MSFRLATRWLQVLLLLPLARGAVPAGAAPQVEAAGATIRIVDGGKAVLSATGIEKHDLRIDVDPRGEPGPLTVAVELPASGPGAWPAEDVEVVDSAGRPLLARHVGIEWHKFSFSVPAVRARYRVRAVDASGGRPPLFSEEDRHAVDAATGLRATIARWHDGRRAALSIRFDDSHPTHLSVAIPALREYGFRGTFMINPSTPDPQSPDRRRRSSSFHAHRGAWEACARRGDQELANHTLHHEGASGDASMDREIGGASKAIWDLAPGKSKLLALNLGGGTYWETTRTLRYYLDKYHLFPASGSLGMDDVYGDRVAAFRRHLERHVEAGGWCRIHFHDIGENRASSEANFRAALDVAKEHEPHLWIAGLADVYKYQTERRASRLALENATPHRVLLRLSCATDRALYDQPLTVELSIPGSWQADRVAITGPRGDAIRTRTASSPEGSVLRFPVPPVDAEYVIERTR